MIPLRPPFPWLVGLCLSFLPAFPATPPATPSSTTPSVSGIRAQLVPVRYTTLSAEVSAKIVALPIREGDSFKAGDLLVALDASIPRAQLARARAELAAARSVLEANTQLLAMNSVGRLEFEQASAAVARAEAEVEAAQVLVDRCTLTAPYEGRLAQVAVREFQYVQVGQPLVEILDDRNLELEFIAPSHWLSWVKPGARLAFHVDETAATHPAAVARIGARIDPVSQTISLTAVVDGTFPELIAGMSGEIRPEQP